MFNHTVGISGAVNYSCLFYPVFNIRYIEGKEAKSGALIKYSFIDNQSSLKPKSQLAHNLSLRLGVTLAL